MSASTAGVAAPAAPAPPAGAAARWWLQRPGQVAAATLIAIAGLAWLMVVADPAAMPGMGVGMGPGAAVDMGAAAAFVGVWAVMMAAMMLPSAIPMIGLYATVKTKMSARSGRRAAPTALFAGTYLAIWALTGVPVYLVSAWLAGLGGDHHVLRGIGPYAVALVLMGAGAYQFSASKQACLRACRGPLSFLAGRWRPGVAGTVRVGAEHAAYCLGCCWALMVVLVAAGAMGLAWTLLIAAIVFVEKVLPHGDRAPRLVGAALLVLGSVVALRG